MKYLLAMLIFTLSLSTFAYARSDFNGSWTADSGELYSNKQFVEKCTRVEVNIVQTANTLVVSHVSHCPFVCNPLLGCPYGFDGMAWGPYHYSIEKGNIYRTDDPYAGPNPYAGKISRNELSIFDHDSSMDWGFYLEFLLVGDQKSGRRLKHSIYMSNGYDPTGVESILQKGP